MFPVDPRVVTGCLPPPSACVKGISMDEPTCPHCGKPLRRYESAFSPIARLTQDQQLIHYRDMCLAVFFGILLGAILRDVL
jgi:hypothetical protein